MTLYDLLLHRYHNIAFVLNLDTETGIALIYKALEQDRDDRLFQQWVAQLPYMDKGTFISFPEYRDRVTGANIDRRPAAQIMAELDAVERELQREGTPDGS